MSFKDRFNEKVYCRWGGEGHIFCIKKNRDKTPNVCLKCPKNPDIEKEELKGFF